MEKKQLNNEIILCRSSVRKAKVAVIRKILKKIKILKACKVESSKEKKLKKSERLYEKMQIIKKLKDDEVTKFALKSKDLLLFLKNPHLNPKQIALACLAKHDAVVKRVNFIREQFQNWESELPNLLDSLGENKKKMLNKNSDKTFKHNSDFLKKNEANEIESRVKKMHDSAKRKMKKTDRLLPRIDSVTKSDVFEKDSGGSLEENKNLKNERIQKIDDPFFIEKKVVAPKLLTESFSNEKKFNRKKTTEYKKEFNNSITYTKPSTNQLLSKKPVLQLEEDKLHPSWAAKRVKLIKPFQGKKITFSEN